MAQDTSDELGELREQIDEIDDTIAALVAERVQLAEEVAAVKLDRGSSLVDEGREEVVESRYADAFAANGLSAERGEELARFLVETSLERERRVE